MPTTSAPAETLSVTVARCRLVTADIAEFTLESADGSALPRWSAGAHIDVHIPGVGVRQYSLCSDPGDRRHYRIAVLRELGGRGGSAALHGASRPAEMQISMPRNNFELVEADRYVFVAGGIGITPILPMIAEAQSRGARWELHYGGRSAASMAYRDVLARHGGGVHFYPQDEGGHVPIADIAAGVAEGTRLYCCGPAGLIAAVEALPLPSGCVHLERFTPVEIADDEPDRQFTVRLASSGLTLEVGADQSLLEVLEAAGVAPLTSCREGTCASCETLVCEGDVLHRDSVLTDEERQSGGSMMVCVSRARSKVLVLDL